MATFVAVIINDTDSSFRYAAFVGARSPSVFQITCHCTWTPISWIFRSRRTAERPRSFTLKIRIGTFCRQASHPWSEGIRHRNLATKNLSKRNSGKHGFSFLHYLRLALKATSVTVRHIDLERLFDVQILPRRRMRTRTVSMPGRMSSQYNSTNITRSTKRLGDF